MNRKIVGIIILAVVLVGGLYYFAAIKDGELKEKSVPENNITEDIDENVGEKEASEDLTYDIAIGEEAPDFTLKDLNGDEVSLSDYRGKIVLINFWATWCKYCDIEMPDLQKLDKENDDLVVLAVDVMEKKSLVEEYIEKGGYDFQVVLDEDGDIAKTYLVSAFPTSYFVDKDGILLGGVPGMMTYAQMTKIIEGIRESE
ncbi:TlpA family protein disulfide reductase [Clostridium sp. Cult2]|uniref:TlpA family protein disulfide reductase n=1 Tax=Clostridium sp. Cult2 TaxID=2079003 RepID=UPI001F296C7C